MRHPHSRGACMLALLQESLAPACICSPSRAWLLGRAGSAAHLVSAMRLSTRRLSFRSVLSTLCRASNASWVRRGNVGANTVSSTPPGSAPATRPPAPCPLHRTCRGWRGEKRNDSCARDERLGNASAVFGARHSSGLQLRLEPCCQDVSVAVQARPR